jgi:ABC-type transport system involved in multi-copper enzyme maturation permease subunit
VIPFFVFGLKSIFNSPTVPISYESRDWVMCCSLWFLSVFGLKSIFNSPTHFYLWKQDWVMCCSFCDSFLCVWSYIFNSPTQFLPMKAGLSDVLLFVIPFFVFGLRVFFFNSPNSYLWKQGLSDVLPLWFLSCVWS